MTATILNVPSMKGKRRASGDSGAPMVYVSYSRDSSKHAQRVVELTAWLRQNGVDCVLDREADSSAGILASMENQIHDADYVLVVYTEKYWRRMMGVEDSDDKHNLSFETIVQWEDLHHDDGSWNTKFVPIVFDEDSQKHFCEFMRDDPATPVGTENDRWNLCSMLTGHAAENRFSITQQDTITRADQMPEHEAVVSRSKREEDKPQADRVAAGKKKLRKVRNALRVKRRRKPVIDKPVSDLPPGFTSLLVSQLLKIGAVATLVAVASGLIIHLAIVALCAAVMIPFISNLWLMLRVIPRKVEMRYANMFRRVVWGSFIATMLASLTLISSNLFTWPFDLAAFLGIERTGQVADESQVALDVQLTIDDVNLWHPMEGDRFRRFSAKINGMMTGPSNFVMNEQTTLEIYGASGLKIAAIPMYARPVSNSDLTLKPDEEFRIVVMGKIDMDTVSKFAQGADAKIKVNIYTSNNGEMEFRSDGFEPEPLVD